MWTPGSGGGGSGGGLGGTTGGTTEAVLIADGAGGETVKASSVVINTNRRMSGVALGFKPNAGGATLSEADSGSLVYIEIGGGADTVTLPAAPASPVWYEFVIPGTDALTVQAQGSHVIRIGALFSSAGGTATSSTQGSRLQVVFVSNQWVSLAGGVWVLA